MLTNDSIKEELHQLWCELLGRENVGGTDDFFEAGGNSLMAVRMLAKIGQRFGTGLDYQAFFQNPSIETLSRLLIEKLSTGGSTTAE